MKGRLALGPRFAGMAGIAAMAALLSAGGPVRAAPDGVSADAATYRLVDTWNNRPWQLEEGRYGETADISTAPDGTVYVLDGRHQAIHIAGPDGRATKVLRLEGAGTIGDVTMTASRLDVAADGTVLVLFTGVPRRAFGPARVDMLAPDGGRFASFPIEPATGAYNDIAAGPSGTIFLSLAAVGGIFDPSGGASVDIFERDGTLVERIEDELLTFPTGVDVSSNGVVYVINRVPSPGGMPPPGPSPTPEPSGRRSPSGAGVSPIQPARPPTPVEGVIVFDAQHTFFDVVTFSNAEDVAVGPAGVFVSRHLEIFRLGDRDPLFAGPTGRVVAGYFGRTVFHLNVPARGGLLASVNHCYTQGVAVFPDMNRTPLDARFEGALDGPELEGPAYPLRVAAGPWVAVMEGRFDIQGYRPDQSYLVSTYSSEIQTVQRWSRSGALETQLGLCSGRESWWVRDVALAGDTVVTIDPSTVQGRPDDKFPAWRYWPGELSFPDGASRLQAVSADSTTIAVLDAGDRRVVLLTHAGALRDSWSYATTDSWSPGDIAVVGGRIVLAGPGARQVAVHDVTGAQLDVWEAHDNPVAIAAGLNDRLFVLGGNGWAYRYDLTGTLEAAWRLPLLQSRALDIAVDDAGRVYVNYVGWVESDTDTYLITQSGVWVFEEVAGVPVVNPEPGGCIAAPDKFASPDSLPLGDQVLVTLTVSGRCPGTSEPLQMVLLVDNSRSMNYEEARDRAVDDAMGLVGAQDPASTEVALVTFAGSSGLVEPLTRDTALVGQRLAGLEPWGDTALGAGLDAALAELTGSRANPNARRVVVIFSDGVINDDPLPAVAATLAAGIEIHLVVYPTREYYQVDPLFLAAITGAADRIHFDPPQGEIAGLSDVISGTVPNEDLFETITVTDIFPGNMAFVPNSASPPATVAGNTLTWQFTGVRSAEPIELTYVLEPQQVGLWPTNVSADAAFTDALGRQGTLVFPIPTVRVWDRSTLPVRVFLPATLQRSCVMRPQPQDIAIVLDTSSSMAEPASPDAGAGTKLDAAKAAVGRFLDLLARQDRAAVVAFDETARIESGLTSDLNRLRAVLGGLQQHEGTRIDQGLVSARDALQTARPEAGHTVILLTDGRHNGQPDEVLIAAAELKRSGIGVFTIGLGADVDADLLRSAASSSGHYYEAPQAADLSAIYEEISALLPCGP